MYTIHYIEDGYIFFSNLFSVHITGTQREKYTVAFEMQMFSLHALALTQDRYKGKQS